MPSLPRLASLKTSFGLKISTGFKISTGLETRTGRAALLAVAALIGPGVARADLLDDINPTNWFGKEKYETKIINDPPADQLYTKGLTSMRGRDFEGAAKSFSTLEKAYPYSQYQRKGLVMTTFNQYQNAQYDEAIGSAKRYLGLYPNSTDSAYVQYLQAMSTYNQIPDISHDQDRAEKAVGLFEALIAKYPKSEYVDDARYKIGVARDQLAGKEMSVGRYYLERREYTAAVNRFRTVLAKYQTTRHSEEALERLTEAYLAMGLPQEAQTAAAVLGHNYPESSWYKEAFARLKGQSLAPSEDQGSWISRTFKKMGMG